MRKLIITALWVLVLGILGTATVSSIIKITKFGSLSDFALFALWVSITGAAYVMFLFFFSKNTKRK